ncbi:hypothetical protein C8Q76DRAFT_859485 [Earliella scabrosa]|nr:hypothetical protein C8Q76DRAFT_859485 [Earliella scabrosa]
MDSEPITKQLVSETTGAVFMSSYFSTMLYGLLLHQAYRYYRLFPKDSGSIRLTVFVVMVLETAYTICMMHYCYYDFVVKYGSTEPFKTIIWSGNILPLLGILTGTTTHIFFIQRVSLVAFRFRVLALFTVVFHLVQNSFGIGLTIIGLRSESPRNFTDHKVFVGICFGFAVAADIAITGAMFGAIQLGRKRFKRDAPKSMVDIIIISFINTGLLILILDVITLILALASSGNLYWVATFTVTSRGMMYSDTIACLMPPLTVSEAYTNTLFSVLNSRKLQIEHGIHLFSDVPLRTISRGSRVTTLQRWNLPEAPEPTQSKIAIRVSIERDEHMSRIESQPSTDHLVK